MYPEKPSLILKVGGIIKRLILELVDCN